MSPRIAVFDIDGTVALMGDRIECLSGSRRDWDSFYARVGEDTVNEPVRDILWALRRAGWHVVFVTGRRESCREDTLEWLSSNLMHAESKDLYMRPMSDYRLAEVIKEKICTPFMDDIVMAFDDDSDVCAMWRRLGKTCLQVAERAK